MIIETQCVKIGDSQYYVQGADTNGIKALADILGLKYDSITPSKLFKGNGIVKIWAIGELYDYLNPAPKFTIDQKLLALSWKQPFANLMLYGKIETRTWSTNYRGWVLICSSKKGYDMGSLRQICGPEQIARMSALFNRKLNIDSLEDHLPNGVAIAIGRLVDCRPMNPGDENSCFVKYYPDLFCHIYKHITPIDPLEFKGSQGWKSIDGALKAMIADRMQPFFCVEEGDGKSRCRVQCPYCESI